MIGPLFEPLRIGTLEVAARVFKSATLETRCLPDGRTGEAMIEFYEHVRSAAPVLGLLQDAITPVWSRAGGGCHPNRDTTSAIRAAGFIIDDLDLFAFKPSAALPSSAHVIGHAHHD